MNNRLLKARELLAVLLTGKMLTAQQAKEIIGDEELSRVLEIIRNKHYVPVTCSRIKPTSNQRTAFMVTGGRMPTIRRPTTALADHRMGGSSRKASTRQVRRWDSGKVRGTVNLQEEGAGCIRPAPHAGCWRAGLVSPINGVGVRRWRQAARRRRWAAPTASTSPDSLIAQVPGSGTAGIAVRPISGACKALP